MGSLALSLSIISALFRHFSLSLVYFHVQKKKKFTFTEPLLTLSSEWPSSTVDIKRAHGTDEVPRTDCWVYLHILQTRQRHKVRERDSRKTEKQKNKPRARQSQRERERKSSHLVSPPLPRIFMFSVM